jgi:hypothetical protein
MALLYLAAAAVLLAAMHRRPRRPVPARVRAAAPRADR